MDNLEFLESHHMQHLDCCPHVPTAVASQKAIIFRNIQDLSHFHSRCVGTAGLKDAPQICVYGCTPHTKHMHSHTYVCAHKAGPWGWARAEERNCADLI